MASIFQRLTTDARAESFYLTIEPGFVHLRGIETVLDTGAAGLIDDRLKQVPKDLHPALVEQRIRAIYAAAMLRFCIVHQVPTLGVLLATGRRTIFCSTEKVFASKNVWKDGRIQTRLRPVGNSEQNVLLEYSTSHFYATSVRARMEEGGSVSIIAVLDRVEDETFVFRPLVIGFPSVASDDPAWSEKVMWLGYEFYQNFIQDFDEFQEVRTRKRPRKFDAMRGITERAFQSCLAEVLGDAVSNHWGGERSDHFSANLHLAGRPVAGAFLLKGPARFVPMTLNNLGKNNDQIVRLSSEPADVLFVQHCHEVTPPVRATLRAFAVQPGQPRRYCVIDGRDSLWFLKSYGLYRRAVEMSEEERRRRRRKAG